MLLSVMPDRSHISLSPTAARPSLRPIQPPLLATFDKNALLCFQSLARSSQFAISQIPNIFCALRTLCEKHPGVGVPKHFQTADFAFSQLNPMESYSFARYRCNLFRILLFRKPPGGGGHALPLQPPFAISRAVGLNLFSPLDHSWEAHGEVGFRHRIG